MAAERRLAAIVFTDIVGYTALSQQDEPAALRLLQEQERLVQALLQIHRGRKVKSTGDGFLLEFPDALDAVECAVDLQRHVNEWNAREGPPNLLLRVGIHLGDVRGVGTDILGDAVNVASRIEPLAEPGGVCLSEPVYALVRNKVSSKMEGLGPRSLKGVQEPVGVYRVVLPWTQGLAPAAGPSTIPRIAVLPLANISPDPKDEYFADGLTEELITILSQLHELRVIARTSVTPYKATPKPIGVIGHELGVAWVLEGSVRKAGDQLRITVQLIDVATQEHTWAETYDRKLEEIFVVQSEVAKKVAETLRLKLRKPEEDRLDQRPEVTPDSYLAYLRGREAMRFPASRAGLEAAKGELEQAIQLDSQNARAYAALAQAVHRLRLSYSADAGPIVTEESLRLANRAVELDPRSAEVHTTLGLLRYDSLDYAGAKKEFRVALSIDPSSSETRVWYAALLEEGASPEEALRELQLAKEANPRSTAGLATLVNLLIMMRRLEEAKVELDRWANLDPGDRRLHETLSEYYLAVSDPSAALREVSLAESIPDVFGNRGPSGQRAWIYACLGESARAKETLEAVLRSYPETMPAMMGHAAIYAVLGELDECFRWLDRCFEKFGGLALAFFRLDPWLESVRRDPRFARVLERMKLN